MFIHKHGCMCVCVCVYVCVYVSVCFLHTVPMVRNSCHLQHTHVCEVCAVFPCGSVTSAAVQLCLCSARSLVFISCAAAAASLLARYGPACALAVIGNDAETTHVTSFLRCRRCRRPLLARRHPAAAVDLNVKILGVTEAGESARTPPPGVNRLQLQRSAKLRSDLHLSHNNNVLKDTQRSFFIILKYQFLFNS